MHPLEGNELHRTRIDLHHAPQIDLFGKEVEFDTGRDVRARGDERYTTGGMRPQQGRRDVADLAAQGAPGRLVLDIDVKIARRTAWQPGRITDAYRWNSGQCGRLPGLTPQMESNEEHRMVLQVAANAWQIGYYRNAELLKFTSRTNAGTHQHGG